MASIYIYRYDLVEIPSSMKKVRRRKASSSLGSSLFLIFYSRPRRLTLFSKMDDRAYTFEAAADAVRV